MRAAIVWKTAEKELNEAKLSLMLAIDCRTWGGGGSAESRLCEVRRAATSFDEAQAAFKKIPKQRREQAWSFVLDTETRWRRWVGLAGVNYSGETNTVITWGERPEVRTERSRGENYRSGRYHKTDAVHRIMLDPLGVVLLRRHPEVASRSSAEGLPLLALYPDGSAVWAEHGSGKTLSFQKGWLAWEGGVLYHSTESIADARQRLGRKIKALARAEERERRDRKETRRAELVVRLCPGAKATLRDAKDLGYCEAGIEAFQRRHKIGDEASLKALLETGNQAAATLALHVARRVKRAARGA